MFLLFNLRSIHLYWWLCDNNYSDWTLDSHSLNLCWIIQAEMCIFFYFQIWISFSLSLYLLRTKEWVSHTVQWFPSPHSSEWKNPNYQIPSGQIMVTSIMKFIELTDWLTDWAELNWPNGYMLRYKRSEQKNSFFSYFETSVPSIVLLNVFLMFFHSDIIITNGCEQLSFVFCTFMNGIHVCDMMTFVSKSSFKMNLFFTLYQNSLAKGQRS